MSDTELDYAERSSEIPCGGSPSLQQDSGTVLPSTVPTEQLPESADLASTFSLFKDYFDKKLSALKRDIQEDSLSNTDSIAIKLKQESKVSFKFKGNKKQFYFISDLAEKVQSASTAPGKRKLEVVKGYLEEIDADIKKRNKLIRLADKSAAGWDLVNEYLSDELASGSEDEKRIRRAELRALCKRKERQQQKGKSTGKQFQPSATKTSFTGHRQPNFRSNSRLFTASNTKRSPATSASRVVNKAIGGLSAVAYHVSVLQVLVYQMLVCPQVLEVNKNLPENLSNKLSINFFS